MGRTITPEMKKAMRLIKRKNKPMTPYAAAKAVGIQTSTIYRSRLYKEHLAATEAKINKIGNES